MTLRLLLLLTLGGSTTLLAGQTPATPPVAGGAKLPSATLQPSLDTLKQAVSGLTTDKWKATAAVRTETEANLASIQRDLQATLPALLAAADAAPNSAAKLLPAYRNVEALYDVLLRVDAAGRLAAPPPQNSALDQALLHLDEGRRTLGDRLQADAEAQEKRGSDLEAALKAAQAAPPPPVAAAPACPAPPVKKKARPVAKPVTPPPAPTSN